MAVPHNVALAASLLEQGHLSVVKAWLESGGDANGLFDPDALDGGRRAPSLPNGVFWHVLSYWRETG